MNALLRRLAATALVPMSLWSAPASAHPEVVVVGAPYGYARPPVRVEYRPQMPCDRAVWVAGTWSWTAYGWSWIPGYWQVSTPVVYAPVRPAYPVYPAVQPRPAYAYPSRPDYGHHDSHGHAYGHDQGRPSYPSRPTSYGHR